MNIVTKIYRKLFWDDNDVVDYLVEQLKEAKIRKNKLLEKKHETERDLVKLKSDDKSLAKSFDSVLNWMDFQIFKLEGAITIHKERIEFVKMLKEDVSYSSYKEKLELLSKSIENKLIELKKFEQEQN